MKGLALAVALVPAVCSAQPELFFAGGIGAAERENSEPPYAQADLGFEGGFVYHIEGGARLDSGLMLRGNYAYTKYDELTALGGALTINHDFAQRELHLGAFYAPRPARWFEYRVGGGYATFGTQGYVAQSPGTSQGVFAEAAAVLHTGARLSWDLSVARQLLDNEDVGGDGTDLRLAVSFRTAPFYVTLAARRLQLAPDDELVDYRFSVGRSLGRAYGYLTEHP